MERTESNEQQLGPSQIVGRTCSELSKVGSEIRRMFLLSSQMRAKNPDAEIFDLTLGNPDLEPPTEVTDAFTKISLETTSGMHRYMDNAGFPYVRREIAKKVGIECGQDLTEENVFMTCGAAGGIQLVMRLVLDPEDEVILFSPYFSEYVPYTMNFQARNVVCATDDSHQPDTAKFAACLSEKTRLVVINSPNNPSGVIYNEKKLVELFQVLHAHRLKTGRVVHVLSDEPYNRLCYEDDAMPSVLKHYDAAWVVRSHSKDLGLAGERIGYLVWGKALQADTTLGSLRTASRALGFVNAPAMAQRVLPLVLEAKVNVSIYRERIEKFTAGLAAIGVACVPPEAGFFAFPKSPILDEAIFVNTLAERGVFCVGGSGFGKPGYVRCSLTCPSAQIDKIIQIFSDVVKVLKP